jgi:predicted Zn-dependent peptidase
MVFKGTPHRTALDVNLDFDRIGADYNAFTSEENTVFHACVLPEYLPRAIDILADILRPSLRGEDFDTEKKVILEEIGMYEDQPAFCAYDNAKRLHFGDHRLGNSILGSIASITSLQRDQMEGYFRKRYVAPNITVAVAGNVDWPRFVAEIERHCGDWPTGSTERECLREAPASRGFELMVKGKVLQEHVILVGQGPPARSPLRYASYLLSTAVGDDTGSRLYWELVDPGLADSADFGFHEYDGTGSYYTSYSCEPDQAAGNLAIVRKILEEVQQEGISEEELTQARNKMLSRLVRSSERPRGRMMSVGMTWQYQGEYRSMDDDLKAFEKVTLADVREVLDRYPLPATTTLALGPLATLQS